MQNVKHHRCQENRTDIDPDMTTWQSYQTDLSLWNRTSPQLLILYIYTHTNHHTNKYIKNNLTLMIYFRLQKCPNSIGARLSADHSHPVWSWTVGCHSGMWHIDSGRNLKLDPLLPVSYLPHVNTVKADIILGDIPYLQIIWFQKIFVSQLRQSHTKINISNQFQTTGLSLIPWAKPHA